MLLVHAGNRPDDGGRTDARFPASELDAVRARVAQVLTALRPSGVLSAPAAGADLVVLGEAQRLGIPVHVLLPIAEPEFVSASVADAGAWWVERFDDVMVRADVAPSTITRADLPANGRWYIAGNRLLLELAARVAAEHANEPVVALTIRPPGNDGNPSVTDDFADRAAAAGLLVLTLDPRPGAHGVTA